MRADIGVEIRDHLAHAQHVLFTQQRPIDVVDLQDHASVIFGWQKHLPGLPRAATRIAVGLVGVLLDGFQIQHTGKLVHKIVKERGIFVPTLQAFLKIRTAREQVQHDTRILQNLVDGLLDEDPLVPTSFTAVQRQWPKALFLVAQFFLRQLVDCADPQFGLPGRRLH
ncbi:hypothetical protein D3C77_209200 [compost metagenome]